MNRTVEFNHLSSYYTQNFASTPTNLFRNSGAKFVTVLTKQAFSKIKSATLRMNMSVATSTVQLCPTPYWFTSISFKPNNGAGEAIAYYYDDSMYLSIALLSEGKAKHVQKICNMSRFYENSLHVVSSGASGRIYYLPLIGTILDVLSLYWGNSNSDIQVTFTPASDIRISGTGTVSIDAFDIIFETENLSSMDEKQHISLNENFITTQRYLDPLQVQFSAQTLTASTLSKFNLNSIVGDVAFLAFFVRAAYGSNTDNANLDFVSLGDSGTVDILDAGSKSILGNRSSLSSRFL